MEVKWIIEHFIEENNFHKLAEEVKRQEMEVELIEWEPIKNKYKFSYDDCVICVGSLGMAEDFKREKVKYFPGFWLSEKNYDCLKYFNKLGKYLLNDKYFVYPKNEVKRNLDFINTSYFGKSFNLFFRPNNGLKSFSGFIANSLNFEEMWKNRVEDWTSEDEIIIISNCKQIDLEWRFVYVDDKIVSGCQYKKNGEINYSKEYDVDAWKLAQEIGDVYQPDLAFTVDICLSEGQYKLVEINSFSCAGIYEGNLESIVKAVSELTIKEFKRRYNL